MYDCEKCSKTYKRQSDLTKHRNKEHPEFSNTEIGSLRKMVFDREYGNQVRTGTCPVCQATTLDGMSSDWDVGHFISKKNGGSDTIDNLKPICRSCNVSMKDTNWYDYLVKLNLPISDDVSQRQAKQSFKSFRLIFEHAYSKIMKKIHIPPNSEKDRHKDKTKHMLINLRDLKLLSKEPKVHDFYFKKIFSYETIKDRQNLRDLENYLNAMYEYNDKESFIIIADALKKIAYISFIKENVDEDIKQIQISYAIYLIATSGNERKLKKCAIDLGDTYKVKLLSGKEMMSLAFYTIDSDENEIENENEERYRTIYDIVNTYL